MIVCGEIGCSIKPESVCESSCCKGTAMYCEEHLSPHECQGVLDDLGHPKGFFGDKHDEVLKLVYLLWDGVDDLYEDDGEDDQEEKGQDDVGGN